MGRGRPPRPSRDQVDYRQSCFLRGAPLALIPALFFLPSWLFLVHAPRFTHATLAAWIVFPLFAAMEIGGIRNLVTAMGRKRVDMTMAVAFGTMLILLVCWSYAVLFCLALKWELP